MTEINRIKEICIDIRELRLDYSFTETPLRRTWEEVCWAVRHTNILGLWSVDLCLCSSPGGEEQKEREKERCFGAHVFRFPCQAAIFSVDKRDHLSWSGNCEEQHEGNPLPTLETNRRGKSKEGANLAAQRRKSSRERSWKNLTSRNRWIGSNRPRARKNVYGRRRRIPVPVGWSCVTDPEREVGWGKATFSVSLR
jgi:hypothetical protein